MIKMTTEYYIKRNRVRIGMTQVQFAKALSVSFASVNRWENGHSVPLPDRMKKMRALFAAGGKGRKEDSPMAPLAVVQIMRRGKWIDLYEVREGKCESAWSMDFDEPVEKIRVEYRR